VSQLSPRPELEPDFRDYEPIHGAGLEELRAQALGPDRRDRRVPRQVRRRLLKFKFLFSMFVSAAVYVWIGGWWFRIGLVVLLFVHGWGT
jgi:hypothetical protein